MTNPPPGTPSIEDIKALETLRLRLSTVVKNLEGLQVMFYRGQPMMDWPTLQAASQTLGQFMSTLQQTLSEHSSTLSSLQPYPLPTLHPLSSIEGVIQQLLSTKNPLQVDDWIAERLKVAGSFCDGVGEFVEVDEDVGGRAKGEGEGEGEGDEEMETVEDDGGEDDDEGGIEKMESFKRLPGGGTIREEELTELWDEAFTITGDAIDEWQTSQAEAIGGATDEGGAEKNMDVEMKDAVATTEKEKEKEKAEPRLPMEMLLRFMSTGVMDSVPDAGGLPGQVAG
ncbi:hypothetical protein GQ43DRAFT_465902 [Delitschia confertaspora ATCC 74209]|uniref:Mediator of RNA polymerase II transcription subunit 8 n=1 Tax=Delitschia confertaspora ATCC 74209 TaxID=1513339 RepID=A0A9P4JF37_9PLEO|nr:hypothetical protein GQ43DRAFT_465902 [Delitschia confertaspora ATCC 74209]